MMSESVEKPVKVHSADKSLQARIGTGPLDERAVERSQKVMDNNTVDFAPMALEFLDELERAIAMCKKNDVLMEESIAAMTTPVMQLKANASTFRYNLIGNMANIMLSFLEAIQKLDEDAVAIVTAHHQTLKAIVTNKMAGDGGPVGQQMEDELKAACKRYFGKRTVN